MNIVTIKFQTNRGYFAPTEEGLSEKVCYCVCPDCVGTLQDKVFDYYDEALAQGYESKSIGKK